ncbi:MAG: hypothetical protein AAF628_10665 [Planctomycetota bacterium]
MAPRRVSEPGAARRALRVCLHDESALPRSDPDRVTRQGLRQTYTIGLPSFMLARSTAFALSLAACATLAVPIAALPRQHHLERPPGATPPPPSQPVPEPTVGLLFGSGLLILGIGRLHARSRRRRADRSAAA